MINKIDVVKYRLPLLTISVVLVAAAIACVALFNFRLGIDFTGGALWQMRAPSHPQAGELEKVFSEDLKISDAKVTVDPANGIYFVRVPNGKSGESISESLHQNALKVLKAKYDGLEELGFQAIGPTVSAALKERAIWAIILVLIGISCYIAFAFRKVSRPVKSWTYGWITLVSLLHDVAIPAGLLAILGKYFAVDMDTNSVVALLVVMGFSVHDTIVVFDRIRENLFGIRSASFSFSEVVNASVRQTLVRSVNTSLTLIFVLAVLLAVGPQNLWYFILTLLVGVTAGTYSSIFVAVPVLYLVGAKKVGGATPGKK